MNAQQTTVSKLTIAVPSCHWVKMTSTILSAFPVDGLHYLVHEDSHGSEYQTVGNSAVTDAAVLDVLFSPNARQRTIGFRLGWAFSPSTVHIVDTIISVCFFGT
jgi:hypothetical protein